MMDMNGLIFAGDVTLKAAGTVDDPPDLAAFIEELRRALLQYDARRRQALYEALSAILPD